MKKIIAAVIGFSILFFTYQFSISNRSWKAEAIPDSVAIADSPNTLKAPVVKPGGKTGSENPPQEPIRKDNFDIDESSKLEKISAVPFDFENSVYTPVLKPILIFFVMIAGMIANQAYTLIQAEKKNTVSIRNILDQTFQGKKFWTAILISPLIFAYFFSSIDGLTKELPCYLLGFQNGFFWHTVFSKSEKHEPEIPNEQG